MRSHVSSSRIALAALTGICGLLVLAGRGHSQVSGGTPSYVRLQVTTPGNPQTGHSNISGTLIAGNISTSSVAVNATGSVDGVSSVADKNAVFGVNRATLTIGSLGSYDSGVYADGGSGKPGLFAVTGSTTQPAVDAEASSANDAVYARSSNGAGLHAVHDVSANLGTGPFSPAGVLGDSGTANGILGVASGVGLAGTAGYAPNGYGVYGYSVLSTGVYGLSAGPSNSSIGVWGSTPALGGVGVWGLASASTSLTIGVLGSANASPGGYGVYAVGKFTATGTKSFQIDHPFDPENKVLNHYCAEGPQPLNVYQGHVTTGPDGLAWVVLPDYFEAINRDPEYLLTVLDGSSDFVLAKVTQPESGNRFQIRTSKPRVTVSWEVKAVRNDRFVQRYGAPVEAWKEQRDRGKYLQPELYGKPKERGQFYRLEASGPLKRG